ncbi:MAG TPA: hypothetical protein ENN46_01210, partial [Candidatus Woesearchaeota archaeon]|nr:hypothetical protein [Candidatus Woesearchaeota archaeon]
MPAKKVTKAEKAEEVTEAEAEKMPEQLKEKVQEKKDGSMAKEKETPEAEAEMAEGFDNDAKVKEVKGDELKKPQDKISEEKKASTSGKKAKAVISSQEKTMKGTEEDADSNSDQPDSTSPLPKEVLEEFAEDVEAEKKPEKIKQRDRRPSFDEWAP